MQAAERVLQRQTATAEVLKVISRSPIELKPVLETLVEIRSRLCEADNAIIYPPSSGTFRLVASLRFSQEYDRLWLAENPDPPVVAARKSGARCWKANGSRTRYSCRCRNTYSPRRRDGAGFRTMLGVPLLREGVLIGVLP